MKDLAAFKVEIKVRSKNRKKIVDLIISSICFLKKTRSISHLLLGAKLLFPTTSGGSFVCKCPPRRRILTRETTSLGHHHTFIPYHICPILFLFPIFFPYSS